jgi:hypothetical protein
VAVVLVVYACSSDESAGVPPSLDAGDEAASPTGSDAASPSDGTVADASDEADAARAPDARADADADGGCFVPTNGVTGRCMSSADCSSQPGYEASSGLCASPSETCCTKAPSVADNPPPPAGWVLMPQASVTPDMTTWAVSILNDPVTYPMFSTATKTFGSVVVMAVVEWHPPDLQNSAVHRGVTLYEPSG